MPSGRIHSASSMVVAVSSATTMLLLNRGIEGIAGVASGALIGILVNCDADVDSGSIANFYIRHYTGQVADVTWKLLWTPYAKLCKHRGFISHFPVTSTIIRVAYLSVFYFLVATPLKWVASLVHIDWPLFLWWAFVGLVLADSAHWGLDKLDEAMGGRL